MNSGIFRTCWRGIRPVVRILVRKYDGLPSGFQLRKILAIRIHGAGDVLLTTPAIRALRGRFPDAEIHYLTGEQAAEVLRSNPDIDRVVPVLEPVLFSRSVGKMIPVIRELRRQHYDMAVIFSRSAGLHAFVKACGIRFRVGIDKQGSGALLHLPVILKSEVCYEALDYLEVVRAVGGSEAGMDLRLDVPVDDVNISFGSLTDAGLDPEAGFGVMAVGGGRNPGWDVPQKRWSITNFAAIAQDIDIPWVVVGDEYDRQEVESCFPDKEGVINLCGGLTLMQSAALIQHAGILLTNDTVALHFGVALGTRMVALFGPTHPKALLPDGIKNITVLQGKLPCVPCFWQGMEEHVSNFGDANFPGCAHGKTGSPCLNTVTVSEVVSVIESILNKSEVGNL